MFTMAKYLKHTVSLHRFFQTSAVAECAIRTSCFTTQRCKSGILKVFPFFKTTVVLPSQTRYFSDKFPKRQYVAVSENEVDEEKNSDSDDDSSFKEEDYLISVIKKGKLLSSSEWEVIKEELYTKSRIINPNNVDSVIINVCSRCMELDMGLSYVDHLSVSGKKLNVATIASLLRMCYNCKENGVNEQFILSMYEELRSRNPILDAYTAESAILGLCVTSRWRECLDLLDMIKLTCTPGGLEYNALIKAAFDNSNEGIGYELLAAILQLGRVVRPATYHAWLDHCDRTSKDDVFERWNLVQELLMYLVENDLKPTVDVLERVRSWYLETADPNTGLSAEFTTLTESGICKSCRNTLNSIYITPKEFDTLRSAFMEKVVVGSDIFRKTTPEELNEYKNFVKMTAPYDIVIDGLNVAFSTGHKRLNPKVFAKSLNSVVKHFVKKSKKILVLGRKHMQIWPREFMDYVYRNANVFLAENISQDDPFLLYAALYSGLGTQFVSKDLMRSHSYVLQSKALRSTFRRWQLQHQLQIRYITETGKVNLKYPLSFSPMAQISKNGTWHIPYEMEFSPLTSMSVEVPSLWLCLTSEKAKVHAKDKRSNEVLT